MTEEKKKPEIIFAPGCFDNFEGTQEELDQMVADIHKMFESGEAFENAKQVDIKEFVEGLSDEEIEMMLEQLRDSEEPEETVNSNRKLH